MMYTWDYTLIRVSFFPEVELGKYLGTYKCEKISKHLVYFPFLLFCFFCFLFLVSIHWWLKDRGFCSAHLLILEFRDFGFFSFSSLFFLKFYSLQGSQKCDKKVWFLIYTRVSQIMTFHTELVPLSLGEEFCGYCCLSKLNPLLYFGKTPFYI